MFQAAIYIRLLSALPSRICKIMFAILEMNNSIQSSQLQVPITKAKTKLFQFSTLRTAHLTMPQKQLLSSSNTRKTKQNSMGLIGMILEKW